MTPEDVRAVMARSFCDDVSAFNDGWGQKVVLCFRMIDAVDALEHDMNKLAAWATRWPWEFPPAGRMCHVEAMVSMRPGELMKFSVIQKFRSKDAQTGAVVWLPGCAFFTRTDAVEFSNSKYIAHEFHVHSRSSIKQMVHFLLLQNGQPFNMWGFRMAVTTPMGWGVRSVTKEVMTTKRPFFCTEFISVALIVLFLAEEAYSPSAESTLADRLKRTWPSRSNPNKLYRMCVGATDPHIIMPSVFGTKKAYLKI